MPSKNRGLLCTQIKARTEGSKAEFPEKVIPEETIIWQCMSITE